MTPGCSRCWSKAWPAATALLPASWPNPTRNIPGTGLHTHFSVIDKRRRQCLFIRCGPKGLTSDDETGRRRLPERHALIQHTCCSPRMQNSYERLVPEANMPRPPFPGDMRTAHRPSASPPGSPSARRIEHRVAGGDVNPYLMLAGILGAALDRDRSMRWTPRFAHRRQCLCGGRPAPDRPTIGRPRSTCL